MGVGDWTNPAAFNFTPIANGLGSNYGAVGGTVDPGMNAGFDFGAPMSVSDMGGSLVPGDSALGASPFQLGNPSNGIFGTGMNGGQLIGTAFGGLETLGKLWGGLQMLNLAKKQFNFSKDFSTANLGNQIKSYNTALADRARSRAVMESQTPDQMNSYVNSNSLSMPKSLGGGS